MLLKCRLQKIGHFVQEPNYLANRTDVSSALAHQNGTIWSLFYWQFHGDKHMDKWSRHYFMWNVITHPCPNFQNLIMEVHNSYLNHGIWLKHLFMIS